MRRVSDPPAFFSHCAGVGVLSQGGNRYASPTSYRAAVQVRGKSVLGKAPGETDGQGLLRVFLRLAFGLHCPCPSPSTKAALEGI